MLKLLNQKENKLKRYEECIFNTVESIYTVLHNYIFCFVP